MIECIRAAAKGNEHGGSAEVEDAGEEGQVAHPVHPGRDEACEITEGAARPDVDSALFGMAG